MTGMMKEGLGWWETQYLKRAVEVLSQCQATLANMQVISYYVTRGNDAEMYKMNLGQLEKVVGQLSRLLLAVQEAFEKVEENKREENKIDNSQVDVVESLLDVNSKMRKDIEDKTRLCDKGRIGN